MAKKTKSRTASKGKRASEDMIHTALSILEEMSKSDKAVQVMVFGPMFTLDFEATVTKGQVEGYYALSTECFDMNVAPSMSDTILFSPEGGVFLSRKGMGMTIEPEERGAEELLARYPGASKLIH